MVEEWLSLFLGPQIILAHVRATWRTYAFFSVPSESCITLCKVLGNDSAFIEPPMKGILKFVSSKCYYSSSCHVSSIGTNSSLKITNEFLYSWNRFRVMEKHFTRFETEGIMKMNSLLPVESCIMYFLFLEQTGTAKLHQHVVFS